MPSFVRQILTPKEEAAEVVKILNELTALDPAVLESTVPDNFGRGYEIFLTTGQLRAIKSFLYRVKKLRSQKDQNASNCNRTSGDA